MSNNTKKLPLWPIFVLVAVIALLFVLNPLCRYVYTKHFVENRDMQLAEILAGNLEELGLDASEKPLFFLHSAETVTNGSCLDLSSGKYNIFSIFSVAEVKDYEVLESSQYIVTHLNEFGYDYKIPTKEDYALYQQEVSEDASLWKSFPWYDGILETQNCILVELAQIEIDW